jgi:hypothetical protein
MIFLPDGSPRFLLFHHIRGGVMCGSAGSVNQKIELTVSDRTGSVSGLFFFQLQQQETKQVPDAEFCPRRANAALAGRISNADAILLHYADEHRCITERW